MNPQAVRDAIKTGLDARPAWDNIDIWSYPAGAFQERKGTFELGAVTDGADDLIDLAGDSVGSAYNLQARITLFGVSASETDFGTVETAMVALKNDIRTWLGTVNHGKGLGVASVDALRLVRWEWGFEADGTCVAELLFGVQEYD